MSQLEFGQERNLRACIDPAKRIRATRHGGQLEEISLEVALSFLNLICFCKDFLQEVAAKVLFTNRCRWQNFSPSLLRLVNNCVEFIYKAQKTRTKVLPSATVGE